MASAAHRRYPTAWQRKMMWAALTAIFMVLLGIVGSVIWAAAKLIAFLQPILIPVAIAAILAYVLDPVVTHLARGMLLLGLNFAPLIGLLVVFLTMIPYIGIVVCWIPAVLIATAQWGDWTHHLLVTVVFFGVQNFEAIFIAPRIVGNSVGLHPMTVIVSIVIWGLLIGGLLGADPRRSAHRDAEVLARALRLGSSAARTRRGANRKKSRW